ncbi:hypothetical protein V6R21_09885 [Limibacter armeniacum]|uniref:hypothetical protein n=1 Tax=Limibacter armeniacum TaxID=466084 RepID=UPI002FE6688B
MKQTYAFGSIQFIHLVEKLLSLAPNQENERKKLLQELRKEYHKNCISNSKLETKMKTLLQEAGIWEDFLINV